MFRTLFILLCGFILGAVVVENKQYFSRTVTSPVVFFPDGGQYDGELLKGDTNGQGRIVWPDGRYYEGEFKRGYFHGQGFYQGLDYSYRGDFVEGVAKGKGVITFDDDRVYEGEVLNGQANGQGILRYGAGEYIGEFSDNQFNGQGKLIRTNGDIYEGEFADGLFHGEGLFTSADGKVFKGRFVKGAISGMGDYRDGEASYTGEFQNWLFHGKGTYSDKKGEYQGDFVEGRSHGSGEYRFTNGTHYRGEFRNGVYHGEGALKTNEYFYEGSFEYGVKHGEGVLRYPQPLDGVSEINGLWQYDELIESDHPLVEHDTSVIVENVLYEHAQRLQTSLDAIKENNPDRTELYFLGVAGDGSQGVFRREVTFIQEQFDRLFATQGKSLSLINSDVTYQTTPLATTTSIDMALQGLAKKMDPENDILFIYMTSHGSADFHFQLDQPGLNLGSLSAEKMGEIIQSLPIRYKVVVISACYAGGYVIPIKDDDTMIIVASAADRTSFGCSDLSTMTYFGEAFFKDALPQSVSFVEAFEKARDIVKGREAKENFEYSNPLIFKPESIRKQLAQWREDLSAWQQEQNRLIE